MQFYDYVIYLLTKGKTRNKFNFIIVLSSFRIYLNHSSIYICKSLKTFNDIPFTYFYLKKEVIYNEIWVKSDKVIHHIDK